MEKMVGFLVTSMLVYSQGHKGLEMVYKNADNVRREN